MFKSGVSSTLLHLFEFKIISVFSDFRYLIPPIANYSVRIRIQIQSLI